MANNDALAARNRAWFVGREILAVNLVSAPGAGKTMLLERTIRDLGQELALFVLEGDQATARASVLPAHRWSRSIPAPDAIWRPTWWRAA
jgi:Ni2+-binding GTPase involved in maturation of urease and hydrogenase